MLYCVVEMNWARSVVVFIGLCLETSEAVGRFSGCCDQLWVVAPSCRVEEGLQTNRIELSFRVFKSVH